jgi:hypothetical protein
MINSLDSRKLELAKLRLERLKLWGGIASIAASLALGFIAYFKQEEDPGAKGVYKELSHAVEKISEDQIRLHRDVSALRGYLAGKANTPVPAVVKFLEDPAPARSTARRPVSIGVAAKPKAAAIIEEEPKFDVPEVEPAPAQYDAPPIEQVTKK